MVATVTAISGTSPSTVAQIWNSLSITSQPDNAWVAARQSQISADRLALQAAMVNIRSHPSDRRWATGGKPKNSGHSGFQRRDIDHITDFNSDLADARLSGESERIGTAYFDEDTPFGQRFVIV